MVQEGVAWFSNNGGSVDIPVKVFSDPVQPVAAPLKTFSQAISSPLQRLSVKPGDTVLVPVNITNTSSTPWSSGGKYPVTVSYRWFEGQTMLQEEGARTFLPGTVYPGQTVSLSLKTMTPANGMNLTLKVTLVQEGVAWFMSAGGVPLELPAELLQ